MAKRKSKVFTSELNRSHVYGSRVRVASLFKSHFKSKNFMTPDVVSYGKVGARLYRPRGEGEYYELSRGRGLSNEQIFGVTVIRSEDNVLSDTDLNKMFNSKDEARGYINELKGRFGKGYRKLRLM